MVEQPSSDGRAMCLVARYIFAADVDSSPSTARSRISVCQGAGDIYIFEPYFRNTGKRLVKSPNVYFADTGLLLHLYEILDRKCVEGLKSCIRKVTFLPTIINKNSQPMVLKPSDEGFSEVLKYMQDITNDQGLGTEFIIDGDEVIISNI